ncbi:MAG: TRAP transporter TatT component family protein, partial [Pseudomonadota bacterium]|nr:TRAP transporter TatT component family protein [Pseudomonadota bacterium]
MNKIRFVKAITLKPLVLLCLLLGPNGCASLVVDPLLESLTRSLEQETDIELLVDGSPTLLLMINGFITSDPENPKLLRAGTRAFSAYAILLHETGKPERARLASEKARDYGFRLLGRKQRFKENIKLSLAVFKQSLLSFAKGDAVDLFWCGQAWALWIKMQGGSPMALVDLPKVEEMMLRVVELDESTYFGSAHLVLGSIYCSLSPMLGGKPEVGRRHFEQALTLSRRQ